MSVVGSNLVCQVGFIVKDIYATKKKWAEFFRSRRAGSKSLRRI